MGIIELNMAGYHYGEIFMSFSKRGCRTLCLVLFCKGVWGVGGGGGWKTYAQAVTQTSHSWAEICVICGDVLFCIAVFVYFNYRHYVCVGATRVCDHIWIQMLPPSWLMNVERSRRPGGEALGVTVGSGWKTQQQGPEGHDLNPGQESPCRRWEIRIFRG